MTFDTDEPTSSGKAFVVGIVLFALLVAGFFYYFSSRDVQITQATVSVDVPIPTDTKAQAGPIDPDTAPPVSPRGVPNFAVPQEESKLAAPMPASAETPKASDAKGTAE